MSAEECPHLLNPDWCADCNGKAAQEKAGTPISLREDWVESEAKYKAMCCAPAGEPA